MNKEFIDYIEEKGWMIVCESPLELEDTNGFCVSGKNAQFILDEYEYKHNDMLYDKILKCIEDASDMSYDEGVKIIGESQFEKLARNIKNIIDKE